MRAATSLSFRGIALALIALASCDHQSYCYSDLECRAGSICDTYYNRCKVPECLSDQACGRGKVCSASYECKAGCRSDDDCERGFVCIGLLFDTGPNQCKPGCRSDSDCSEGNVCAMRFLGASKCTEGCRSNADCLPGTFCPSTPPPGTGFSFTDETPQQCAPGCHDDGECAANEICDVGYCISRCRTDSDCGSSGFCAALHAAGSFRRDDAGRPTACDEGERCRCASGSPRPPSSNPTDAGLDVRKADGGASP